MLYVFSGLLFVLGLIFGSFLNVLIWRYRPEKNIFASENIGGRSRCPYCGKTLGFFELVPLFSFILQRGKCRGCNHALSWQYPLVELLGGFVFSAAPIFLSKFYSILGFLKMPPSAPFWFYAIVLIWVFALLVFILIAVVDLRHFLIPDELNKILAVLGILLVVFLFFAVKNFPPFRFSFLKQYFLLFSPSQNLVLAHILGAVSAFLFFWLVVFLSRGRAMGFGDVKLALVSGFLLGWPDIGLATILSFIFGGIWGVCLILLGRKKMRDKMPFAPFFVLGIFLTFFCGYSIINFYFQLFGLN